MLTFSFLRQDGELRKHLVAYVRKSSVPKGVAEWGYFDDDWIESFTPGFARVDEFPT